MPYSDFTVATKQNDGVPANARGTKMKFQAPNGYFYVGALVKVIESRTNYPIYRLRFADGSEYGVVKNVCTPVPSITALSPSAPQA